MHDLCIFLVQKSLLANFFLLFAEINLTLGVHCILDLFSKKLYNEGA